MGVRSRIITQLLSSIEDGNVERFSIALPIALAQQPPIDLNQIHQNGHTILTFAGSLFFGTPYPALRSGCYYGFGGRKGKK